MINMSFRKRYFKRPKDFFLEIRKAFSYGKKNKGIDNANKISLDMAEKIMLAVTGVNSCVFCSYRHTESALKKGVDLEEIQNILKGEFGNFPQYEAIALVYAQHWTESGCNPDVDARNRMLEFYGEDKTGYIEVYMQRVYMGNLVSNTVEAYNKKVTPETGKIKFFFVYLLCAPMAFFIQRGTSFSRDKLKGKVDFIDDQ